MTTKQFNSKGQLIEELDCPPYPPYPPYPPLKKVEPNPQSLNSTLQDSCLAPPFPKVDLYLAPPFPKVDLYLAPPFPKVDLYLAPPFPKVDVDENEILAWCEYYLHSKKKERKLDHIYFPSTLKKVEPNETK